MRLRVACVSAFDIPCADVSVADFIMERTFSQCQKEGLLHIHPCVYPMRCAIEEKEGLQRL